MPNPRPARPREEKGEEWQEERLQRRTRAHVGVVHDRRDDPECDREATEDVNDCPPRYNERRSDVSDLAPVEGEETHPETRRNSEELVHDDVVCKRFRGQLPTRNLGTNG